jgi:hypothetical protein
MSSIALNRILTGAVFALISASACGRDNQSVLSCQDQKDEGTALKQAPHGARRPALHTLEVITRKGPKHFNDKPPHDEGGMTGQHWRYCGYSPQAKAHLLGMTDTGLFSGKLVLDETGETLRAGHTVLLSPNGMEFLAIEQEDGVDGESWFVYDIAGKAIWSGYAGTVTKVKGIDTVRSTFEHPKWNMQGELTARFVCTSSLASGIATLGRASSNNWFWHGSEGCR